MIELYRLADVADFITVEPGLAVRAAGRNSRVRSDDLVPRLLRTDGPVPPC
jgi:hypothetical protein